MYMKKLIESTRIGEPYIRRWMRSRPLVPVLTCTISFARCPAANDMVFFAHIIEGRLGNALPSVPESRRLRLLRGKVSLGMMPDWARPIAAAGGIPVPRRLLSTDGAQAPRCAEFRCHLNRGDRGAQQ